MADVGVKEVVLTPERYDELLSYEAGTKRPFTEWEKRLRSKEEYLDSELKMCKRVIEGQYEALYLMVANGSSDRRRYYTDEGVRVLRGLKSADTLVEDELKKHRDYCARLEEGIASAVKNRMDAEDRLLKQLAKPWWKILFGIE